MKLYTKANPKIQDYNPITHTSFYNQSPTIYSTPMPRIAPGSSYNYSTPDKNYQKFENVSKKNIFAQSGSYISRSASINGLGRESPLYSKTRPKDKIVDPISGEVKIFKINRPKIESLDTKANLDRLSNDVNVQSIQEFYARKNQLKPLSTVSGSLRKEVNNVPYVNPFLLRTSLNNYRNSLSN